MSQSPSSAGAMGIGNVLNIKGEPGVQPPQQGSTPEQQQQQQPQPQQQQQQQQQQPQQQPQPQPQPQAQPSQQELQAQPRPVQPHPQIPVDRPNSPHSSEQSRYSGPMNASYPSPTVMGAAPLPPVPSANMAPAPMVHPEMPPNVMAGIPPGGYKPAETATTNQPPPKAYPCSTCGKPFARRSDLARHGKHRLSVALGTCAWLTLR